MTHKWWCHTEDFYPGADIFVPCACDQPEPIMQVFVGDGVRTLYPRPDGGRIVITENVDGTRAEGVEA